MNQNLAHDIFNMENEVVQELGGLQQVLTETDDETQDEKNLRQMHRERLLSEEPRALLEDTDLLRRNRVLRPGGRTMKERKKRTHHHDLYNYPEEVSAAMLKDADHHAKIYNSHFHWHYRCSKETVDPIRTDLIKSKTFITAL